MTNWKVRLNGKKGFPLFSILTEGVTEVDLMLHAAGWILNVVNIVVHRRWSGSMYVTLVVVVRCCLVPSLGFGVLRKRVLGISVASGVESWVSGCCRKGC